MAAYSRRDFLKVGASALLGAAFVPTFGVDDKIGKLGRVTANYLRVYLKPSAGSNPVGWKKLDEVVEICEDKKGDDGRIWHHIAGGYIQASEVQPVDNKLNQVVRSIEEAFIAEVTIPFVDARRRPDERAAAACRLYYASTIWVRDVVGDANGVSWYKLYDERLGISYFAPASSLRKVSAGELSAISPDVTHKRIVVNLAQQRLSAYEGRAEVFSTLISAGRLHVTADGLSKVSWTPNGLFTIDRKRPSRHMGNGDAAGSDYELPGVPWVSYFHWKGFSLHGTWWHNDFGRPRSAGCVNMRPSEALWLYRWSHPTPLPDQEVTSGGGTQVEIVES